MSKTLAVRTIENGTAIVVIGADAPSDDDWELLVRAARAKEHVRTLVVTDGGGPSPRQRKAILDASGGKGLPAAVITDSLVVRGIATAISWFVDDVRAYPPSDLQGALGHLRIRAPRDSVQSIIDELKRELADANRRAHSG